MKLNFSHLAQPHWLAAVLLCAATLSLSACGGDSNDGTPGTNPGAAQPDQPGEPPANKPSLRCAP